MNFHGGFHGEDNRIKDFSVNINPFGVPDAIKSMIIDKVDQLVDYPAIEGDAYKRWVLDIEKNYLMSSNQKVDLAFDNSNVIIGNGATELIYVYAKSQDIKKILLVEPTFSEYKRAFELNNIEVISFILNEENDFAVDIQKLEAMIIDQGIDGLCFCNPNNPTSHYLKPSDLEKLLHHLGDYPLKVFTDESFIEFSNLKSSVNLIDRYDVFILRSLTKSFGIPGIRIGYGMGKKETIEEMTKYKEPWSLNLFALESLRVMAEDKVYLKQLKRWIEEEKEYMYKTINQIKGVKAYPTHTNFLLLKFDIKNPHERLMKEGFYLRPCIDFKGLDSGFLRTSVRTRKENELLINAIEKILYESK